LSQLGNQNGNTTTSVRQTGYKSGFQKQLPEYLISVYVRFNLCFAYFSLSTLPQQPRFLFIWAPSVSAGWLGVVFSPSPFYILNSNFFFSSRNTRPAPRNTMMSIANLLSAIRNLLAPAPDFLYHFLRCESSTI
jgi:hypothetical protein